MSTPVIDYLVAENSDNLITENGQDTLIVDISFLPDGGFIVNLLTLFPFKIGFFPNRR